MAGTVQLFQSMTAAQQIEVEQQFLARGYTKLSIDALIVLAHGVDADKRERGNLRDLALVDIVLKDVPFRGRQQSSSADEGGEHFHHFLGELSMGGVLLGGQLVEREFPRRDAGGYLL